MIGALIPMPTGEEARLEPAPLPALPPLGFPAASAAQDLIVETARLDVSGRPFDLHVHPMPAAKSRNRLPSTSTSSLPCPACTAMPAYDAMA